VLYQGRPPSQQMAKNDALEVNHQAEAELAPPVPPAAQEAPRAEGPVLLQRTPQVAAPLQRMEFTNSLAVNAPAQARADLKLKDVQKVALADEVTTFQEARKVPALNPAEPFPAVAAPAAPVPVLPAPTSPLASAATRVAREEAPVLATFEFQQAGETVRVIDADGSVYDGKVVGDSSFVTSSAPTSVGAAAQQSKSEPASLEVARRPVTALNESAQGRRQLQPQQLSTINVLTSYSFRVRGTNLRSQQSIELDGVLTPNAAPVAGVTGQTAPAIAQKPAEAMNQAQAGHRMRFYRTAPSNAPAAPNATLQQAAGGVPPQRLGAPSTNVQMLQRIQGVLRVGGNAQPIDAWQAEK